MWLMAVKLKEPSFDQSTHLFLVMFFLAHHGAPFCSEYYPPILPPPFFSALILSAVLFFSAAQVFSMGLFTCVNVLHFHSFFWVNSHGFVTHTFIPNRKQAQDPLGSIHTHATLVE